VVSVGTTFTCKRLHTIVCKPVSVNVLVTLTTQEHLEYHCEALFETPCITPVRTAQESLSVISRFFVCEKTKFFQNCYLAKALVLLQVVTAVA
jgi:hypothetical protein